MVFDEFAMLVLVWDEAKGGVTRIAMRRLLVQPGGEIGNAGLDVLGREVPSSHPAVTRIPGGVLVAWTEAADTGSLIGVQRVGLDMVCSVGTSEAR